MVDITPFIPWASLIVSCIAIYAFFKQRRDATMQEGKKQAENEQLKEKVRLLEDKVVCLEAENRGTEKSVAVIEANVANIIESLKRIEAKLEKRLDAALEKHEE